MRMFVGIISAAMLLLTGSQLLAQDYPSKTIRIVVPFAPGGIVDTAARIVGQKLQEAWGQPVIVENRPGGSGTIGVSVVAKSPADGHTLLMAHTGEFGINPAVFSTLPYDLDRDFVPVTMVIDGPGVFLANANAPYKTLQDLIAAAKAAPNTIGVSVPGKGTLEHLMVEWTGVVTGAKFLVVPYRGGTPAATAVAGGEVPAGSATLGSALSFIQGGQVRVLAVTTGERSSFNKDWPTIAESGAPGVQAGIWAGLFAPKGTPQPVIDKINAEVAKVLEQPDVKERFATGGSVTRAMRQAEFSALIHKEAAVFKDIVTKAGIKVE